MTTPLRITFAAPTSFGELQRRRDEVLDYLRRFSTPDATLCARAEAGVPGAIAVTGSGRSRAARSRQNITVLLRRFQSYISSLGLSVWPICPIRVALFLSSHLTDAVPVLKRTLASYRSDLQGIMNAIAPVFRNTRFAVEHAGLDLLKDVVAQGRTPVKQGKKRGRTEEAEDEPVWCHCRQPENSQMIHCEEPSCSIGWYHLGCVGEQTDEDCEWICPSCRQADFMSSPGSIATPQTPMSLSSMLASPITSPMIRELSFGMASMPLLFPPSPSTTGLDALADICAAQPRVASTMHHSHRYSPTKSVYSSVRTTSEIDEPPFSA